MTNTPRALAAAVSLVMAGALVAGCSQDGGSSEPARSSPPAATQAAASAASTSGDEGAQASGKVLNMTAEVAPSLTMHLPESATATDPGQYADGRRGITFLDASIPVSVIVEYAEPGGTSAKDMVDTEKASFESQSASVTTRSVAISGGTEATRLDWTQESPAPWGDGSQASTTTLVCAAVIFQGENGYAYAVYIASDSSDPESVATMEQILSSIEVAS